MAIYFASTTAAYGKSLSAAQTGATMSFLTWIVLGLIAGFIGSKIVNRRGEGMLLDILLGVVGAFFGGWLFHIFGAPGVSGLNLYSVLSSGYRLGGLSGSLSRRVPEIVPLSHAIRFC